MQCPSCGSTRVYPSRLRSVVERLRRSLTGRHPVRCHQCGWRRWQRELLPEAEETVVPDDLRTGRAVPPVTASDLDRLDSASRS
jgi:DNA-directed RNA polymerase subunit RPC12/RpoP